MGRQTHDLAEGESIGVAELVEDDVETVGRGRVRVGIGVRNGQERGEGNISVEGDVEC